MKLKKDQTKSQNITNKNVGCISCTTNFNECFIWKKCIKKHQLNTPFSTNKKLIQLESGVQNIHNFVVRNSNWVLEIGMWCYREVNPNLNFKSMLNRQKYPVNGSTFYIIHIMHQSCNCDLFFW